MTLVHLAEGMAFVVFFFAATRLGRRRGRRQGYAEGFNDGLLFGRRGPKDLSAPTNRNEPVDVARAFLADQRRKADLQ